MIQLKSKNLHRYLTCFIIIYPLLFVWQGLDMTDMGFSLTNYQQFFQNPESVQYSSLGWLTNFIGWVWYKAFGWMGVAGFKIAFVLIGYACLFLSYLMLRNTFSKPVLILSLFITLLFCTLMVCNWIHYNILTSLFFIVSIFFIYGGLKKDSRIYFFIGGFFIGLNIFVRFPNLLGISFAFAILFHGHTTKKELMWLVKSLTAFMSGCIVAMMVTCGLINLFGHWDYFCNGLQHLFKIFMDSQSHHSSQGIIKLFLEDYITTGILTVIILCITAGIAKLRLPENNIYLKLFLLFALSVTAAFVLPVRNMWSWSVTGMLYVLLFLVVHENKKNDSQFASLAILAFLFLFVAPLGSDTGLRNAKYGMWLAMPLALSYLINLKKFRAKNFFLNIHGIAFVRNVMILSLLFFSVATAYRYTYRDSSDRFAMAHSIKHPMLKGVFTTKKRAAVVQELLDELKKYVSPGDYLLAYENISTIYFLTETVPYLYNSWPMLYGKDEVKYYLKKAQTELGKLPVVVRAKGNTRTFDWPQQPKMIRNDQDANHLRMLFDNFIYNNKYTVAWENYFFEILTPSVYRR